MIALSFSSSCPSSSRIQWLGFEDEDEQEDDLVHGPDTRPKWPPVMGIVGNVGRPRLESESRASNDKLGLNTSRHQRAA